MNRRSVPREYRDLTLRARDAGWQIEKTRNNHIAFVSPAGRKVFCPSTPSDSRSLANVTQKLARAGLDTRRK